MAAIFSGSFRTERQAVRLGNPGRLLSDLPVVGRVHLPREAELAQGWIIRRRRIVRSHVWFPLGPRTKISVPFSSLAIVKSNRFDTHRGKVEIGDDFRVRGAFRWQVRWSA